MNFLQSLAAASTKAATPTVGPLIRDLTGDVLRNGRIQIANNNLTLYGSGTTELIRNSYLTNGDVYSIVGYIVRKAMRAKFFLYEIKDEKAYSDYRLLKGEGATEASLKKAIGMRRKALVEASNPAINNLITRPNPEQSFKTFVENTVAYKLLTGERMIQKIEGLQPVSRIYTLPPNLVEIEGGGTFLSIGKYTYTPSQTDFKPEEILFSKMFHPALDGYGAELRGLSPLRVMAMQIQKSNEGMLSALKQYQNGGPPGILSLWDEDVPLTPEQAEQYEARLARKAGGAANRGKINITGMKAEWVKMGLSPVDMDILESGVFDLRALCRGYGLDSKVMGDATSSTYSNMAEARKAAIVDAVLPAVEDLGDDLNTLIEPFNTGGKRYCLDADISHFPELAEDLNEQWKRIKDMPLRENEKREAMQYERLEDPLMDEVWFDNSRTPISQFTAGAGDVGNDGTY